MPRVAAAGVPKYGRQKPRLVVKRVSGARSTPRLSDWPFASRRRPRGAHQRRPGVKKQPSAPRRRPPPCRTRHGVDAVLAVLRRRLRVSRAQCLAGAGLPRYCVARSCLGPRRGELKLAQQMCATNPQAPRAGRRLARATACHEPVAPPRCRPVSGTAWRVAQLPRRPPHALSHARAGLARSSAGCRPPASESIAPRACPPSLRGCRCRRTATTARAYVRT